MGGTIHFFNTTIHVKIIIWSYSILNPQHLVRNKIWSYSIWMCPLAYCKVLNSYPTFITYPLSKKTKKTKDHILFLGSCPALNVNLYPKELELTILLLLFYCCILYFCQLSYLRKGSKIFLCMLHIDLPFRDFFC